MTPKTFKIKSFGCQMNVYDGERMAELLGSEGMAVAADGEDADLVVLNTCHIREKAAQKAYSDVGRLKRPDRKSTRLNSSHVRISYAVFCLKKKINEHPAFACERQNEPVHPHVVTHRISDQSAPLD